MRGIKDRLKKQLEFLGEADKMKNVFRQSLIMDGSRRENDAEHSWHFALMAAVLYEYAGSAGIDLGRVLKMALVHDLVEIYAGDTFAYDTAGYETKEERENEAARRIFGLLPGEQGTEYRELWQEFDKMETADSLYAAAIDRFQPFFANYRTQGYTWSLHKVTSDQVYKRMSVVKHEIPELWEFVEFVIHDSIEKGYIIAGSDDKRQER